MDNDFISDEDFKVLEESVKPEETPDFIPDSKFVSDDGREKLNEEKYGTLGQQIITGFEGVAQGLIGSAAPAIEVGLGLAKPEDIRGREETNTLIHGGTEALGFGLGMATGTGEAALLAKAGSAAVGALKLGEAVSLGSRMAAGAARAGTELVLMQADDEITKVITEDPDAGIGNAAANITMSGLLGMAGGPALVGLGSGIKYGLDKIGIKEFSSELAKLGAEMSPRESVEHDLIESTKAIRSMGSDLGGFNGAKSAAIEKFVPELNEKIAAQIPETINMLEESLGKMQEYPDIYKGTSGYLRDNIKMFKNQVSEFKNSKQIFEGLNNLKRELDVKIPFGETMTKGYKELANVNEILRKSLEDTSVWGEAGTIQKELNKAYSELLGPLGEISKKFFSKDGSINAAKVESYMNAAGKKEFTTELQKTVDSYVKGVDGFQKEFNKIAEKIGGDEFYEPLSIGGLRESLNKPSFPQKMARLWHGKLASQAIGSIGAASAGAMLGGIPGAFIAKELLGPVFGAMIQPIVEKTANSTAFQQTMRFGKTIVSGNNKLIKASNEIFSSGAKPLLLNVTPDYEDINRLDEKLKKLEDDPAGLLNISGDLGHYAPAHSEALARTIASAVNHLNSERPKPIKMSPLDDEIEPTKAQKLDYQRTLSIAQNPLSAIKHINDGTLLASDIKTLNTVYPAYYRKMSEQILSAMTDHISKGESIPYKKRQSLSLFLGMPLDSTMKPESIMAAQAVFLPKEPQAPMMGPKKKNNTGKLDNISKDMMTQSQKSESMRNN